ncbi:MAG: substrate-binding domain-containing protein [Candidatus Limnocylindrales bacterium]
MSRRALTLVAGVAALVIAATPVALAQDEKPTVAFLPGIEDPFYHVLESGVQAASADLGLEPVIAPYPATWGVTAQTPVLDALIARGDIDYLITAPVSAEEMIAPLQAASEAGIKIITVDTFLGDGDYGAGPVTFPISYIGTDNEEGGYTVGKAMAEKLGGKGKVYIQNTNQGVSSVDARSVGFRRAIAEYPEMEVVDEQYSLDDAATATQQTAAVLQANPDLAGIFGVNVFSAQGAGTAVTNANLSGAVEVAAYDATKDAIQFLRDGTVSMVLAQKPFDMGYLGTTFASADASGVTSLPKHVTTGFDIITLENVDDPEHSRFIYQ